MGRVIAILLLLVAIGVSATGAFVVDPDEQAIVLQFGAFVREVKEPGLYFKVPFLQQLRRFDRRIVEWDGNPRQITTLEKQIVFIDTYARWRIVEVLPFYESVRDQMGAQGRLDDIIDASTRDVVSRNNLIEMVRNSSRPLVAAEAVASALGGVVLDTPTLGRTKIEGLILQTARKEVARLGIELLDVRIKRVNYIEGVQAKVFERMQAERKQRAAMLRSEGEARAQEIAGEREKEMRRIQSEAYRKAQEIQGRADAEASSIYAQAYSRDPALYDLVKTLETLEYGLATGSVVVLSPKSPLFKLLQEPPGR